MAVRVRILGRSRRISLGVGRVENTMSGARSRMYGISPARMWKVVKWTRKEDQMSWIDRADIMQLTHDEA